ncbi:phage portal protein [Rhodoblastus acidophilus]|nr:phage portal protein [Rhodoblastus acidophilus]
MIIAADLKADMLEKLKSFFASETKAVSAPLSSPAVLEIFNAPPAASGVPVDAWAVLRCPAAQNGVRIIGDAIGTLDARLVKCDGKDKGPVTDHPVARLLKQPNGWTGETEFKRQLIQDVLIWGNGLALVSRVRGEPRELHRIDPRACSITLDLDTTEPRYSVAMQNGGSREYSYGDIVHVRNLTLDGARGLGLVNLAAEAIGVASVLERHAAGLFSRGARPAGLLEYAGKLAAEAKARLAASFQSGFGAAINAGRTLVLEDGMKFVPLQLASTDAQFLENRKFQVLEIARCLNVPAVLLNDLEQATLNNAESLAQQLLDRTIVPLLELFEDALERALLTQEECDAGYEIEFDTSNFTRADTEKRFAAYKSGIESGVLVLNEAREREGLPPVAGGDEPMRSVQTIPLNSTAPNLGVSPEPTPSTPQVSFQTETKPPADPAPVAPKRRTSKASK